MPNGRLFQFRYSYERDLSDIMLKVSIGASGAPTIVNGKGVTSIVRNSAGNYSITLKDMHNVLMSTQTSFNSGASAPAAPLVNVQSETVNSTKIVRIQCRDIAAAAADPASGEIMMIHLTVRDAST